MKQQTRDHGIAEAERIIEQAAGDLGVGRDDWAGMRIGDWLAGIIRPRALLDNGWLAERLHMAARNAVSRTIRTAGNWIKNGAGSAAVGEIGGKKCQIIWTDPNGTWLSDLAVLFLVVDFTKNVPRGGQVLEWFWPSFDGAGFLPKRTDIEDLYGAGGDDFLA